MEKQELLWLAGLWDAEGSFTTNNGGIPSPHGGKQLVTKLAMTDEDVIDRIKVLTQHSGKTGFIDGSKNLRVDGTPYKNLQELCFFGLKGRQLALSLAPYLSDRRRERVEWLTEQTVTPAWSRLSAQEKFMWCSGYVEGEGSFYWSHQKTSGRIYGMRFFELETTDEDAVKRISAFLGLSIRYRPPRKEGHKPSWRTGTSKRDKVAEICDIFYPHMFNKKRGDIERVLTAPVGRLDEEGRQIALDNYYNTK